MTAVPARVGRRALGRLRDGLSKRDWAVLRRVADHHYLTTKQVEAFAFADHATPLAAARACRRVLARLYHLHVLHRLQRRIGGVRAGSASFVWTVGPVGDRLLREEQGRTTRRRWREPSVTFLDHCLDVADTHLALHTAAAERRFDLVTVELEPACWRGFVGASAATETLRPDLYAVTAHDAYEVCWFIEVDRGTESLPRLLSKCAQYEAYRRTGREQHLSGTFPLVVWRLPSEQRATQLSQAVATSPRLDPLLFRYTTAATFLPTIAGGAA